MKRGRLGVAVTAFLVYRQVALVQLESPGAVPSFAQGKRATVHEQADVPLLFELLGERQCFLPVPRGRIGVRENEGRGLAGGFECAELQCGLGSWNSWQGFV